ncbi:hypothetical protein NDA13_000002 [Ustilago tritici]|nr:hypothetical protein NDA13_000002 [Ustilago tritici]
MNKTLQVDEESAFCLLEPGVSYFDLYEELQKRGSQFWVDCPGIGWDLPLRFWTLSRRYLLAVEPWYHHQGWFLTDAQPGGFKPFLITVPRKEDLHELVQRIRRLRNRMIIQNAPTIRQVLLSAAWLQNRKAWEGDEMSEGALPDERDMIWGAIWGSLSQIKGAEHLFEEDVGPQSLLQSRAKTLAGIPNLVELDWISWLDNGSHCFFSPISNVSGDAAMGQWNLLEEKCRQYGFDAICTQVIGLRELHNICCVVYDRTNKDQGDRIRAMMKDLIDEAAKKGWSEYRTHLAFEDQVAGTFNFNNNAIRQVRMAFGARDSVICATRS